MNIEQYRELKAQESEEVNQQEQVEETPNQEEVKEETKQEETKTEENNDEPKTEETKEEVESTLPDKIEIEGIGEVAIDELKNGYLRQSDYTKKTQDVSRQKKEVEEAVKFYDMVKQNPQLAQQLGKQTQVPNSLNPEQARVAELENKVYDMMLEKEISELQNKYDDFEVMNVLETAQKKGITSLEDAYHLHKASRPAPQKEEVKAPDVNSLKEEIRAEILKELQSEKDTSSIISTSGSSAPKTDNTPKLSESEQKVARMMKMSTKEYVKWRDAER